MHPLPYKFPPVMRIPTPNPIGGGDHPDPIILSYSFLSRCVPRTKLDRTMMRAISRGDCKRTEGSYSFSAFVFVFCGLRYCFCTFSDFCALFITVLYFCVCFVFVCTCLRAFFKRCFNLFMGLATAIYVRPSTADRSYRKRLSAAIWPLKVLLLIHGPHPWWGLA